MGIQSWKSGMHSGNTIRAGNSSDNRRRRAAPLLVKRWIAPSSSKPFEEETPEAETKRSRGRGRRRGKKAIQEDQQHVEVEELEDLDENVFYSLNKKGRWNLPEMIRNEIRNTNSDLKVLNKSTNKRYTASDKSRLEYDTTLIECHSMKQGGSNCIGISSTQLPGDGSASKSKTYLNPDSILKPNSNWRCTKKMKKTRKRDVVETQQETDDLFGLAVEVSYPFPSRSYHNYSEKSCNAQSIYKETRKPSNAKSYSIDTFEDWNCFYSDGLSDEEYLEQSELSANSRPKGGRHQLKKDALESDKEPHVWFLAEFVRMSSSEFGDDIAAEEEEDVEEKKYEKALSEAESNSSYEFMDQLKEEADWEIIENEAVLNENEPDKGEDGILGQLIDAALARKASASLSQRLLRRTKKTGLAVPKQ